MSWWHLPRSPGVLVGDEPLDLLRSAFQEISDAYREDHGRRPTGAEVEALLLLALQEAGKSSLFQGVSNTRHLKIHWEEGSPVRIRTQIKCGQYFAVPIRNGEYVIGRLLRIDDMGHLVSLFARVVGEPDVPQDINQAETLLPLRYVMPYAWEEGKWQILEGPGGRNVPTFVEPSFLMGDEEDGYQVVQGKRTRPATREDEQRLEYLTIYDPENIEEMIDDALKDA